MIRTKIVGVTFEDRQSYIEDLREGDELFLERESDNKYDPNAVKVLNNRHIYLGYLNKQLAPDFSKALDEGKQFKVKVIKVTHKTNYQNIGCNIEIRRI